MQTRSLTVGFGVVLLLGAACRPTDACAEPGAACGGDPVGQWTLADSCQDPALADPAISKRSYRGQPATPAGQPPAEPTSGDWCADLVYDANGIAFLNLPRDTPKLIGADLSYASGDPLHATGTYGAFVTSRNTTSIAFSAACLTRFGYAPTCAEFGVAFATFGTTLGGVRDTSCTDAPSGGCICQYTIESDAAGSNLSGSWSRRGNVLTLFASNMVQPTQLDFCVEGDRMTLWGHARTSIMNLAGVRTMHLDRIVCGNGRVERGEQCDPPDQVSCDDQCQTVAPP